MNSEIEGEPADATAAQLVEAYRTGALSPSEALESVLARIAACEPSLRATYAPDPDGARTAAAEATDRWRRGEPLGPVDGVPVTLKENIATRGVPVPSGTAATELVPAERDAPAAARLRSGGAVITTKTTMPDFGMLGSSVSSFHPRTANPWNTRRTPGGSSSGAGAGAAAGYGPLHLGTDIGGSVRQPAHCCGLVGLKPSQGRVPVVPPYYGRAIGPLTRTVDDAVVLMRVVSAPDARDHTSLPPADLDYDAVARAEESRLRGVRIGVMADCGVGFAVEPDIAGAVNAAARRFAAAGADVEQVGPLLRREMLDGLDRFWRARAWAEVSALPPARAATVLPEILRWARSGAELTGEQVFHGFSQMDAMARAAAALWEHIDYLLTPTAPIPAFGVEQAFSSDDGERPFEHVGFTVPFNMSGQPAVSVNCGWTGDGLPIGLQIVGPRFDDVGVLTLARLHELLSPPPRAWPTC